jgi:ABC-2 type transport system permease protein
MRAYYHLTLAQLRMFLRNRQALIWTLIFPFFFMFLFGFLFDNGNSTAFTVSIVDKDESLSSKELIQVLDKQKALKIEKAKNEEQARETLKNGKIDFFIVFPKNFSKQIPTDINQPPASIAVYYNEKNIAQVQTGLTVIQSIIDGASKNMAHYKPLLVTVPKGISGLKLKYLDFLVPGIIAMQIMSNNMNGVASQIASWRERGVLRRMQGTALKASTFIAAQITARLLLNSLQALLLLLIGHFAFDVSVRGSFPLLVMFIILGTLTFISIGFIIAGLAKTPESAGPIAGFISFPLMFLGGVFFPISNMPTYLQPIVKTIPISHLSTAFREIMNVGASFSDLLPEFGWLCAWLVVGFVIATKSFRWE